jgi:ribosome biogenesis protein ENP2
MKVATYNGCKVYNLSDQKALPLWLSDKKKRLLSKDSQYNQRVELIQDFDVPTASQCIKLTSDLEHILITGTYPPVIKCYNVHDMSLKFQRGLTAEVVAFECLSTNFHKFVFLQNDRNLNFHAPYGTHYNLRIPRFGRDLKYDWNSCDLFIGGAGTEIYRLNLELGAYKESFSLSYDGCNKLALNPCHPLMACGGEKGICEFWDLRNRSAVSKMSLENRELEITALQFDTDGLTFGVGTSHGHCILYDIRSSNPLYTKEHQYGVPIVDVCFHNESGNVISTDKKIMKIWKRSGGQMGQIVTNIEPACDINSVLPIRDQRGSSGLFFIAGEQPKIMSYYVPSLGPAPRWCSFLEGITEELEEKSTSAGNGDPTSGGTVYEDYKFITRGEVDELGATALIGTAMLRGYMHGFFIEMSLYNKLRAVSKPFEYEEHKKEKIRQKVEEKRQSRINAQKRLPKYNQQLAEKMQQRGDKAEDEGKGKKTAKGGGLVDDRFSALFDREEFEQDVTSADYKLRNPTLSSSSKGMSKRNKDANYDSEDDDLDEQGEGMNEIFERIDVRDDEDEDDDEEEADGDDDDDQSIGSEDSVGVNEIKYRPSSTEAKGRDSKTKPSLPSKKKSRGKGVDEEDKDETIIRKSKQILEKKREPSSALTSGQKKRTPQMFGLSPGIASDRALFSHTASEQEQRKINKVKNSELLSQRLKNLSSQDSKSSRSGAADQNTSIKILKTSEGLVKELSYMPTREHSKSDRMEKTSVSKKDGDYFNEVEARRGKDESKGGKQNKKRKL